MPAVKVIIHPGEILNEEYLKPGEVTQTAFAKHTGISRTRLNEIINGKRGVTPDTAIRIAKALGTSVELWINMQAHYDLLAAQKKVGRLRIKTMAPFKIEAA